MLQLAISMCLQYILSTTSFIFSKCQNSTVFICGLHGVLYILGEELEKVEGL